MKEEGIPLIIDTDPGIDDAAAIFWVLSSGKFDVKALTITHGNVGLETCTENALRLLEYAGRPDIPVYSGAPKPIMRSRISAEFAHGSDGMGDTDLPLSVYTRGEGHAVNRIIELAKASPVPITILALGPVTNLALAILLEPELKNYVSRIVFMGGAVHVPGNFTPAASFNVAADPEAARIVYRSGIPVVQTGLDVCNQFSFRRRDFEILELADSPIAQIMCRMVQFRLSKIGVSETGSVVHEDSIALNDVAAAAYLLNPDWFTTRMAVGDVETEGQCAGQTILNFAGGAGTAPNVCFAEKVDSQAAIRHWISSLSQNI